MFRLLSENFIGDREQANGDFSVYTSVLVQLRMYFDYTLLLSEMINKHCLAQSSMRDLASQRTLVHSAHSLHSLMQGV
jgi:hypothetical protein